ncbi:DUF6302 family protein [Streptomyces sp. NPDC088812]|uniref:DUF6302 family protein n=1 Tax=Streptomyces sp. NPDC088812 TaxID=3365905 RepID=UPI0037F52231
MPPTATVEEPLALREPGQGWRRPSWTDNREALERIVELLRAGLPIDKAYDDVATVIGDGTTATEEEITVLVARFRGTPEFPGHLNVLIDAVERQQSGEDPHTRERLIFRARRVRAETAAGASLGHLRRLASAAEDLLELLLPDDEAEATPCPPLTPMTEPDITVMPPAEAYDFDYFHGRIDAHLLSRSIAIRVFRMPLLAVPVGGSRRGGWFGVDDLAIALAVRDVLAPLGGFPDLRITWQSEPRSSYVVEWGDRPPATWPDENVRLAFYGLMRPGPGQPRTPSSAVSSCSPTAP